MKPSSRPEDETKNEECNANPSRPQDEGRANPKIVPKMKNPEVTREALKCITVLSRFRNWLARFLNPGS